LAHPRSETRVGVGSGAWPGLSVREAVRRRAGDRSEGSGQRGGPESETGAIPPRPGLLVEDWIAPLACCLGTWVGPGVARCLLGLSLCWEAGPRGTPGL
jgi:hypothetical protein